jgi:predicted RecA/RadA family phage recombinase
MARNFIQPGSVLDLPAPYDCVAGQGALIGDYTFGVAVRDVAITKIGAFQIDGVWELPKNPAQDFYLPGMRIYWDDQGGSGNGRLDTVNTGHVLIGSLVVAAGLGTTTAIVRLSGAPDPVAGT